MTLIHTYVHWGDPGGNPFKRQGDWEIGMCQHVNGHVRDKGECLQGSHYSSHKDFTAH